MDVGCEQEMRPGTVERLCGPSVMDRFCCDKASTLVSQEQQRMARTPERSADDVIHQDLREVV